MMKCTLPPPLSDEEHHQAISMDVLLFGVAFDYECEDCTMLHRLRPESVAMHGTLVSVQETISFRKLDALARALLKARHTAGEAEAVYQLATHLKGGKP